MKLTGGIPPTTPFHLARAYGLSASARVGAGYGQVPGAGSAGAAGEINSRQGDPATQARISRLVGAVVPGKVDFSGDEPAVGTGVLPMYRRPAERNAAATGVLLGKKIDVRG